MCWTKAGDEASVNLTADSNIFFNHKDISEIVFMGYVNEDEIAFRDALMEGIAKADQMAAAGPDPS
ncbi:MULTISPECIES: DUF4176 domain-containing protein [Paenibacillus]|uniref:DUF4176 domain-containing protein n=1 Tax=Paenibacillus sp. FSL F4-0100 TaxID=2921370 RepID=UPI0021162460|nr:DUF4176 domain-containing protein [Paenibacillus lautus]